MSNPEVRCPECSAKAKPVPGKAGRYRCRDCGETFELNDLPEEDEEHTPRRGGRRSEKASAGPSATTLAAVFVIGLIGLAGLGVAGYFALKKDPPKETAATESATPKVDPPKPPTKKDDTPPRKEPPKPPTPEEIVRKVKAATVYVRTPQGTGSGFFAGQSGSVVTNAHVVGYGPREIRPPQWVEVVVASGEAEERTLAAKIYGVDTEADLALLQVDGSDLPTPLPFGKAADLVETQDVVVYGYPFGELLGKNISINRTTVSSLRKEGGKIAVVQLSGGLNPGNSGGPVTNAKGEIIGVSVAKLRGAESIAFAIPAEETESFLKDQYRTGGRFETGGLVAQVPPVRPPFPGPPVPPRPPMNTVIARLNLPPVKPVPITAADVPAAGTELKLPAEGEQVCVGGGGRFLIVSLPTVKQIAVVDLSQAKVAKYLPAASEKMLIAAGMDKLFVVYPGTNVVQRWSLLNFEKDATGTITATAGLTVTGIAMGSASNGPVFVETMDFPRLGERFLFDVTTMKEVPDTRNRGGIQGAWPGDVIRAGADGKVVTVTRKEGGTCFFAIKGAGWTDHIAPWREVTQPALPSADGQTVYGPGDMATVAGKRIGEPTSGVGYLPALHGPFVLAATPQKSNAKRPLKFAVHAPRDNKPLFELPHLPASESLGDASGTGSVEGHVFLAPLAKVIAVLPKSKDRVVLYKVDTEAELAKTSRAYLFVTSQPGAALAGQKFEYAIEARAKKGGLKYKLEFGPPGLGVDADGKVNWDTPANFDKPVEVAITVSDKDGQEVLHTFDVVPAPK